MITFKRDEFKLDHNLNAIFEYIKKNHKPAFHTEDNLIKNKDVKNFCVIARHFAIAETKTEPLYIHYDISNWFKAPAGIQSSIDSISIYDNWSEYEKARITELHSAKGKGKQADIPNIN